jgi:hypothetical protein
LHALNFNTTTKLREFLFVAGCFLRNQRVRKRMNSALRVYFL